MGSLFTVIVVLFKVGPRLISLCDGMGSDPGWATLQRGDLGPLYSSVVHGPAASPGSLLEIQNLRPHPRPAESEESGVEQAHQLFCMHTTV